MEDLFVRLFGKEKTLLSGKVDILADDASVKVKDYVNIFSKGGFIKKLIEIGRDYHEGF